jgi:hypothetical protein
MTSSFSVIVLSMGVSFSKNEMPHKFFMIYIWQVIKQKKVSGSCIWVLWTVSYGPTSLDTTMFPPSANDRKTKGPISDMVPSLHAEGEGPPT